MTTFQDIYRVYGKPVYRFLLKLTGSSDQAEELLQETFYQAFLHIERFKGRCSVYTWLCQIGKNAWLKECKRRQRFDTRAWEEFEFADGNAPPEEAAIRKEEYRRVRQAVLALEEPYQEVFVMHTFGGVPLKEIAAEHEKSESWARVTYMRARKLLADKLL
ncbi:MAG: sigma-70 family RNA polymerase sigma factor [Lachnospiraceae bacterium]|nr:sigma-70 family RNA polymerase sigma factor [Lachnospiraceae bacterium]